MSTRDFSFNNHGSVWLLYPKTDAGRAWIEERLPNAEVFCRAVVVEHRYVDDIVAGIRNDGLEV